MLDSVLNIVQPILRFGVLGIYAFALLTVAVYGLHRYVLVYLYCKHRNNVHAPGELATLPRVTVQLPMFNEDLVAERIIEAACKLDWPRDRLEIQVLDDSTDHSADIARASVDH